MRMGKCPAFTIIFIQIKIFLVSDSFVRFGQVFTEKVSKTEYLEASFLRRLYFYRSKKSIFLKHYLKVKNTKKR